MKFVFERSDIFVIFVVFSPYFIKLAHPRVRPQLALAHPTRLRRVAAKL